MSFLRREPSNARRGCRRRAERYREKSSGEERELSPQSRYEPSNEQREENEEGVGKRGGQWGEAALSLCASARSLSRLRLLLVAASLLLFAAAASSSSSSSSSSSLSSSSSTLSRLRRSYLFAPSASPSILTSSTVSPARPFARSLAYRLSYPPTHPLIRTHTRPWTLPTCRGHSRP